MSEEFNLEFSSDEQLEAALDAISESIERDERKTTVLSSRKYEQMNFAHAVLKYLTRNMKDVSLSYKLHEPFKTMGYITLEGESLEFFQPEWFSRVAEFASNMEVYPLANNRVRLTFTFHGLTKPIE